MANPYRWLTRRVFAILCEARGADGSLGAEAQVRAIAAGRFRPALKNAPLSDPGYPSEAFDRAVRVTWRQLDDQDGVNNPLDVQQLVTAELTIAEGLLSGPAVVDWLMLVAGEDAADAAEFPEERGGNDADRMKNALHQGELWRDGSETDPVPVGCVREGGTAYEALGGGRLLAVSTYRVTFETVNDDPHDPT